jgi:hypothetical protein
MMCIIKLGYTEMSLDSPFSIYLQNSHRGQKKHDPCVFCFTSASNLLCVTCLISHQLALFFSQNKPATNKQRIIFFSLNKSVPATSQTNGLMECC